MRSRPLATLAALVAVAAAGALAACGGAGSTATDRTTTSAGGSATVRPALQGADDAVLVVGDSLTVGARDIGGLDGRLRAAGFDTVEVIAQEGRDAAWGLEQIEALTSVPPLVVVELGTNRSANPAGFAEVVDAVVAALVDRGARRIAWVTPVHAADDRYRDKIEIIEAAGGIELVADWAAVVQEDPGLVTADGLHPTEAGYGRLADFLVDAAADLAGR